MSRLKAFARRRWEANREEAGLAMIIAVMAMLLLTLLPMVVLNDAMGQLPLSRYDQDSQAALDAAQAGVSDLLNHLTTEPTYWSDTGAQSTNPAMNGGWESVPGQSNDESFTYALNTSVAASQGIVYVESTGRSRNAYRTVYVGLRPATFADYVYETDYEILDPNGPGGNTSCTAEHAYDKNSQGGYGPITSGWGAACTIVYFAGGDILDGKVDSNDELHICSSEAKPVVFDDGAYSFYDSPTSENSTSEQFGGAGAYDNENGCSGSVTWGAGETGPQFAPQLTVPADTQSELELAASSNGCLFTGSSTTIAIEGTSLKVTSSGKTSGSTCNGVGVTGSGTYSIPNNGLVYGTGSIYLSDATNYQLSGDLTVASASNIYITSNLKDSSTATDSDMLGLVAFDDIELGTSGSPVSNLTIQAAILAQSHSMLLPNWSDDAVLGTLNVYGSIAQEFRGPVGTIGYNGTIASGYTKDYQYDPRLATVVPPYFPTAQTTAWRQLSFREVTPPCLTPLNGC